jgi:hypothetical protein
VTAAAGQLVFFEKSCILEKTQATIQKVQTQIMKINDLLIGNFGLYCVN